MMNLIDMTNSTTGDSKGIEAPHDGHPEQDPYHMQCLPTGCLRPSGPSDTLFHTKPIVVQGAWLAANELGAVEVW